MTQPHNSTGLGFAYPTKKSASFPPGSPIVDVYEVGGNTLVSVKTGPAAHQISTFDLECIVRSDVPDDRRALGWAHQLNCRNCGALQP